MSFGVGGSHTGAPSGFSFGSFQQTGNSKDAQLQQMDEFNFDEDEDDNINGQGNDSLSDEIAEIEVDEEEFDDVDDVSGVPVTRFEEAPIPHDGVEAWRQASRILKFKLNPNGIDGIGFISQDPHSDKTIKVYPQETKIYTMKTPFFTDSDLYVDFVSNLYSIYEALGDEKNYSVPTIGLVKRDAQRSQKEVLNKAFSMIIKELQSYIEDKKSAKEDESSIFELEECLNIIHCLKALYFSPDEEMPQLISEWVNIADPQPDLELTESIMGFERPYKHPFFWKFIKKLAIRGLYSHASNALRQSGFEELQTSDSSDFNLILDAISLLESYPENSTIDVFKQWRLTATKAASNASIRNDSDLELSSNIRSLLNIISGNKQEILEASETWYEAILALICYDVPTNELLQDYFELATSHKAPNDSVIWESACLNIFEGKFLTMLRSIGSFNVTIAAYISTLCEAKGLLKNYSLGDDSNQATSIIDQDLLSNEKFSSRLLHSHALDCLSISKLIPVGVGILATSKHPLARSVIAEYLPKYDFKSNDDIEWALTVCASLKLPQISNVIYRTAAQRSLASGFLLESLTFFSKAGEAGIVKYHCWNIFENSLVLGKSIDDLVINSFIDDTIEIDKEEEIELPALVKQLLAPYAILYKFWKYQESGDLKTAFKKLLSLLKFPYIPAKLFGVLLSLILPFLSFNIPSRVIESKDLTTLIKLLDSFEETYDNDEPKSQKQLQSSDEFYKFYVGNCINNKANNNWVSMFKEKEIKYPKDLRELFLDIRKKISFLIGKTFLLE
jgi:nuclear pore complex protein Nup85